MPISFPEFHMALLSGGGDRQRADGRAQIHPPVRQAFRHARGLEHAATAPGPEPVEGPALAATGQALFPRSCRSERPPSREATAERVLATLSSAGQAKEDGRRKIAGSAMIPGVIIVLGCLLYTSPSPRDRTR